MEKDLSTEQKILHSTIDCIERYGLEGATIRRIAKIAEVNSAAISYYFRSKDNLIAKALEVSLGNAFDWDDFPKPGGHSLQEYIVGIFTRLAEGSYQFPGLTRAHLLEVFSKGEYDKPAVKRINGFLEEMVQSIRESYAIRDENELRKALTQITSAALLIPSLAPGFFNSFCSTDLKDKAQLNEYISRVVTHLL